MPSAPATAQLVLGVEGGTNNGARAAGRRLPALACHALRHRDGGDAARLRADQAGARAQAALNSRIQQELGDLGSGTQQGLARLR